MAARTATLGALFLVVLLDLLGFGILIPQLGVYALKFQASPFSAGLLLSIYSLMQLVFAPLVGRMSDRDGRRPILLYSIAGSVVTSMSIGRRLVIAMRRHVRFCQYMNVSSAAFR